MAKPDSRHAMVRAMEAIAGRMIADIPEHAVAKRLQSEVNMVRSKAEALDRVVRTRSPLDTPEAHALKVAKMARSFDSEVTAMLNRAGQAWAGGTQDAQRRIEEKVDFRPDAFAPEIRQAVRALDGKARSELLGRLVKENRGPELAAIVKAPSVLTGLTDEDRTRYEQAMYGTHAAAEVHEIAKLGDAFEAVTAVSRAASTFVKELTNPGAIAKIEREAAEAAQAAAAFNQPPAE